MIKGTEIKDTADLLMVSVSGVRGTVGRSFLPHVIEKYVSAFCHLQRTEHVKDDTESTFVLGRDSRVSGPWVVRIVQGILLAMGFKVLDLGIVPTPTVQFVVIKEKAVGGIIITSSHNPIEWNGLKFVGNDGLFIRPEKCNDLFSIAENPSAIRWPSWEKQGVLCDYLQAAQVHIDAILTLPQIDINIIQSRKFKVCLDTVNGAGGPIMTRLLESLGCTVVPLNIEPNGLFSHSPEPIPENLSQLCQKVLENNCNFGIATDPDVDRCVFIDETGKPIGEEYTLALAVYFWLDVCGKIGPVCKNLSTTRAINDIALKHGCTVYPTMVGEIHVANKMIEVGAVIGGEGNGGVLLPDVHLGRDAPVAAALVLQLLAKFKGTLSQLKATLPQWFIVKKKASVVGIDVEGVIAAITAEWVCKGAKIVTLDGIHIETDDWWVHIRKSNTEPVVRIIGEARTELEAERVVEEFRKKIEIQI